MLRTGLALGGQGKVCVWGGGHRQTEMKCNLDGGMFGGNWSKHLSPTKETSGPVNLI